MATGDDKMQGPFYHGTRADLQPGDLIAAGYSSNYGERKKGAFVYLTGTLEAAIWGCSRRRVSRPSTRNDAMTVLNRIEANLAKAPPLPQWTMNVVNV